MAVRNFVKFHLNGEWVSIFGKDALMSASDYLRYEQLKTDTKVVCAEGDCGACSCLIFNPKTPELGFYSFNSCITPVFNLDACVVVTARGLGNSKKLNSVQVAMAENHGAQCGFCTPGFICALSGLVDEAKKQGCDSITEKKARNHLTGNLCRCTGYEPILKAAQSISLAETPFLAEQFQLNQLSSDLNSLSKDSLCIAADNLELLIPTDVSEALSFKKQNPNCRIVSGATDLGVLINKGKLELQKVLSLSRLPAIQEIKIKDSCLIIGARASLTQLEQETKTLIPELSRLLKIFASPQIKNTGTLVGNLINASPIADTIPAMLVLEAKLVVARLVADKFQIIEIPITNLYLDYKKLNLLTGDLVLAVKIPIPQPEQNLKFYKVSLRKDLDISSVTLAFLSQWKQNSLQDFRVAIGGVGPTVIRLSDLEKSALGISKAPSSLEKWAQRASQTLSQFIKPISDLRASKEYRMLVAQNLIQRWAKDQAANYQEINP